MSPVLNKHFMLYKELTFIRPLTPFLIVVEGVHKVPVALALGIIHVQGLADTVSSLNKLVL
jgi:hypothetical protein